MRRLAMILMALSFMVAIVAGCHKEEPELNNFEDASKASEGKEALDGGPAPGGTLGR